MIKACPLCNEPTVSLIRENATGKYFCWKCAGKQHCKRSNGTERAWFLSREAAEQFEQDPANPAYHHDVAHLCAVCGFWHLSKLEWLVPATETIQ